MSLRPWSAKEQKHRVAVVAGARTPFAKSGTQLKGTTAVVLGVTAVREALARGEIARESVDEVILGNAGGPADAANIARVIALRAGIPESTSAFTVQRNCASAMEAIAQGCMKVGAGLADTVVVGGTESMSNYPLIYGKEMVELFGTLSFSKSSTEKMAESLRFRPHWLKPIVSLEKGLTDPVSGLNMGQTAEVLARDFRISREAQDAFALRSHQRAVIAQKSGRFGQEIVPVILEPDWKEVVEKDIGPRDGQSLAQLAKLRPFFDKENGTITPGNACPITDGAVALVLMNEEKARSEGRKILGLIQGFAFTGCEPKRMGMGPVYSTAKLLSHLNLPLKEVGLVELNEAFSAQVMANQQAFASATYCKEKLGLTQPLGELRDEILNVNGGAVALGHPVGATGARLLLTNLLEMGLRKVRYGLSTLCIGGGQGACFLAEAI